jgi:cell division protein FtsW
MGFLLAVTRKRPRTRVLTELAASSQPLPAAA